ncbi:GCN5-related N-acetyltransferase [Candidatus Promineifilum breve]|uniref:GCN5-related N-acetyltransferase n=1 Tax=Candidatus Promineifilum breve TaxID=1806508 RepID=A0A160T2A2_9CHLR|nr:GNAT family N-acetyltransferase [Candidatus Promineifilum breve]CUS04046.2 GCN5-related N-acetyltransferase [Candidatus Promineifilum breve]
MVQLLPMTASDFHIYLRNAVDEYAQDHVKAGNWHPSEALQRSEKEFQELLPDGVASKDQYLFSIVDGITGMKVGILWFAVRNKASHPDAFVYDFEIYEEFRRQGYGTQAFATLEERVQELGLDSISLHVFGHNQPAIALYQAAGYEITNLHMTKKLGI